MKTVEISEIVTLLENYTTNEQSLIIIRNGQPVAVLCSIDDDIESLSSHLAPGLETGLLAKNYLINP
ncbi:hypothetical protein NIES2101_16655 [Calothrix sp. HK-06]|nr:hypothetical protein NIES2101_16655 [Calothrix sp. HK-06]